MSKGELPVPHIIALVIGVAALALLGYWFFSTGGKLGSQTTATVCDSKFVQFCLTNPSKQWSDFSGLDKECSGGPHSFDQCNQIFGIGGSTPTPTPTPASAPPYWEVLPPPPAPTPIAPSSGETSIKLGEQCGILTQPNVNRPVLHCISNPNARCESGSSCKIGTVSGIQGCFCFV